MLSKEDHLLDVSETSTLRRGEHKITSKFQNCLKTRRMFFFFCHDSKTLNCFKKFKKKMTICAAAQSSQRQFNFSEKHLKTSGFIIGNSKNTEILDSLHESIKNAQSRQSS